MSADPKSIVARYLKRADLTPALGYPGGSCYLQRRIRKEVRNEDKQQTLIDRHQSGDDKKGDHRQEGAIYTTLVEGPIKGTSFTKLTVPPHVQYRMDQRAVTMKDVFEALREFQKEWQLGKQKHPGRDELTAKLNARGQYFRFVCKKDCLKPLVLELRILKYVPAEKEGGRKKKAIIEAWLHTAFWKGDRNPTPVPEGTCSHAKGQDWEGWSKTYPSGQGMDRLFEDVKRRVAARYMLSLRLPPKPGVSTYVTQDSKEGLPTGDDRGEDRGLLSPGVATPGGAGRLIPQFSYSGPDADSDIKPRTVGVPGAEYGDPTKYDYQTVTRRSITAEDEETTKEAGVKRRWRPGQRQRKSRGTKRIKRQRYQRRNRTRLKMKAKMWRRKNRNNSAYKASEKRRRKQNRRRRVASPLRVATAYRDASVLTAPDIAFVIGPDMLLGYVRSISPMTGMVNIELDESDISQMDSLPVEVFLRIVVFLSDEDVDAFFSLLDVEIGSEAYEDIDEEGLRECARRYKRDPDSEDFKNDCLDLTGERDLSSMSGEQLELVADNLVGAVEEGGQVRDLDHADNPDIGDEFDPHLYYGEVELG